MIHIVLGTKAQLIKMAPVMKSLAEQGTDYRFISTGQHRETMDEILANFGLRLPDYVLYHGPDIISIPKMVVWATRIIWRTVRDRREVFGNDGCGMVLVHGDTFSTLLGAIMGRVAGLRVGHVEAGLRSFNLFQPFPEELTRLVTFRLAHYLFCPGEWAVKNLEGYAGRKINTGTNTLHDALRLATCTRDTSRLEIPRQPFGIVTIHRFENIYSRSALNRIVHIVERIARSRFVLFILHKPTEKKLRQFGLYEHLASLDRVELRQRYDYFIFIKLISSAEFVVSDGGSNQEECFYLGKPILLLRKATERQEGLGENCVLSRYDLRCVDDFVENPDRYRRLPVGRVVSPSQIIAQTCMAFAG